MIRTTPLIKTKRNATYQKHKTHPNVGKVEAYVNHGRWVADCPCGGAEMVHEADPFECASCGGRGTVEWPTETSNIEEVLERRPLKNQNWQPAETVADLKAQNVLMGVD